MKNFFTKNNIIILIGGIILTLLLLLPSRLSTSSICPKGKTQDPVLGGACTLFVDEDFDGLCDLLQQTGVFQLPTQFDFSFAKEFTVFALLLTTAVLLSLKKSKHFQFLRFALLVLSFFYFGFLLKQSLCPIATLQMLFVLKDKIVLTFFIFLFLLLPILTTFFFGQIFCHLLCPVGAVQEFIFRIPRKFTKIPVLSRPLKILLYLPYLILLLVSISSFYFSTAIFCRYDPFGSLFGCNAVSWKPIVLGGFLFLSLFIFRPFCTYFCPLGAVFKLLEKFRIWRPKKST